MSGRLLWALASLVWTGACGCALLPSRPETGSVLGGREQSQLAFAVGVWEESNDRFADAAEWFFRALEKDPDSRVLRSSRVENLIRAGEFQAAIADNRILLKKNPLDPNVNCTLGRLHAALGDTLAAESFYRAAARLNPADGKPSTQLGLLLLQQGKTREGIRFFQEALRIDPRDRAARRGLMRGYLDQRKFQWAEKILKQGLANEPDDLEWLILLGKLLAERGKSAESLACFQHAVRAYPEYPDGYRFLAKEFLLTKKWRPAAEILERLLALEPLDEEGRQELALAYLGEGKLDEARRMLDPALETGESSGLARYILGAIYWKKNLPHLAVREFRAALRLEAKRPELYRDLIDCLIQLEDYLEAGELAETAAEKFPGNLEIRLRLGRLRLLMQRPKEAAAVLAEVIRAEPWNGRAYLYLGKARLAQSETEGAIRAWKSALQADPGLAEAYNDLGYTFAERGYHLDQAVQWLQKAVALEPEKAAYRDSLGWAYFQQRKIPQALAELEKARALQEKQDASTADPVILEHLAEVHLKLGRFPEARTAWNQAQALGSKNSLLKRKFEQFPISEEHAHDTHPSP